MTDGAIDNDFEDALVDYDETHRAYEQDGVFWPEDRPEVAIDLVTRQPLLVLEKAADSVVEYWEREDFDLIEYKGHRYLPVTRSDTVWTCVFIPTDPSQVHTNKKTYDYPDGRLMRVPLAEVVEDDDD